MAVALWHVAFRLRPLVGYLYRAENRRDASLQGFLSLLFGVAIRKDNAFTRLIAVPALSEFDRPAEALSEINRHCSASPICSLSSLLCVTRLLFSIAMWIYNGCKMLVTLDVAELLMDDDGLYFTCPMCHRITVCELRPANVRCTFATSR
ncbi:hypothetical protein [Paraburkholderia sp. 35.1]|uniref:hypothetical protein n=1 Tax=Paraburkholderia sp. 35.1 TaxID=2991058 RepID=UPI003D1A6B20